MNIRLAVLALAVPLLAAAAEFNAVQASKSRISFVSKQMGVPVEGEFKKFAAQVAFDPARPEAGRAQIELDLAGIDAGSTDADEEVKGKNWFDVRQYPTAKFVSTGVKPLGGNRYEARGQMTIKGRTRDVVAPFAYRQEGADAVLEGVIPVLRLQYGVGTGAWSDTATVADEVQVRFRITLAAGTK